MTSPKTQNKLGCVPSFARVALFSLLSLLALSALLAKPPDTAPANKDDKYVDLTKRDYEELLLTLSSPSRSQADARAARSRYATVAAIGRCGEYGLALSEKDRTMLAKFVQGNRETALSAFSDNAEAAKIAINRIGRLPKEARQLAAPVYAYLLRTGDDSNKIAVCKLLREISPACESLEQSLFALLKGGTERQWWKAYDCSLNRSDETADSILYLVLQQVRSRQSTSQNLCAILRKENQCSIFKYLLLCEVIAEARDDSIVPELAELLKKSSVVFSSSIAADGATSARYSPACAVLCSIVWITGQKHNGYGFVKTPATTGKCPAYGFANKEEQAKAIARFDGWWRDNKVKYIQKK